MLMPISQHAYPVLVCISLGFCNDTLSVAAATPIWNSYCSAQPYKESLNSAFTRV